MPFRPIHIILLLVIILLVFGASKLPDLARNLGKSAKILKQEMRELTDDGENLPAASANLAPAPAPLPAQTPTAPPIPTVASQSQTLGACQCECAHQNAAAPAAPSASTHEKPCDQA